MPQRQADNLNAKIRLCWGKTDRSNTAVYHPAIFHMVDVGNAAKLLLQSPASSRWRTVLSDVLGIPQHDLVRWLPWIVALHDIGKISVSFQGQVDSQKQRLLSEGFTFGDGVRHLNVYHDLVSQHFVTHVLPTTKVNLPKSWVKCVAEAVGGHHGQFQQLDAILDTRDRLAAFEPGEWSVLRVETFNFLYDYFCGRDIDLPENPTNISASVAMLCGFTILCDWLGSDSRYFPPRPESTLPEYCTYSENQAHTALTDAGFFQPVLSSASVHASQLFRDLGPLRPLQNAIDEIPDDILASRCLAIIEAPTGEGKTEAALALARRIAQLHGTDELYYALPTMATSNQMFMRLQTHLRDRLGLSINAKLVHGQAFLIEDGLHIEPLANGANQNMQASVEWFSSKKRALLAPFGVGTIDQAELAALNVRHGMLRLAGLAGKVVIVDEVHAYDTYITTIVSRLLGWLRELGCSVILLSATLPLSRRRQLLSAYGINIGSSHAISDAYPCVIVGSIPSEHEPTLYECSPAAWQPNRQLEVQQLRMEEDDVPAKGQWLLQQVQDGGCVCWINNTVDRAQRIYEWLLANRPAGIDLNLLHSQFPLLVRQAREELLAGKYGRNGSRPYKGIVVGTQVLEQSLDIDFDVMATDLAPIDLLLQRAGRMHRHNRIRPPHHSAARLYVNTMLDTADDSRSLKPDSYIYDEYLLRLTWGVIREREILLLPRDYRPLIEAVYGDDEPNESDAMWKYWDALQQKQSDAIQQAQQRLIPQPYPDELLGARSFQLVFDEDENRADWIVAQTRLGEESVNVIPLERIDDYTCLSPSGSRLDLNMPLARNDQMELLRYGMRISRQGVVQDIKSQVDLPPLFTKSARLRDQMPLWLKNGATVLTVGKRQIRVRLDDELGLVIRADSKE